MCDVEGLECEDEELEELDELLDFDPPNNPEKNPPLELLLLDDEEDPRDEDPPPRDENPPRPPLQFVS